MSDDFREACKLLIECADEVRKHDEGYRHRTSEQLKEKLRDFFTRHGLNDPTSAAEKLCSPPHEVN